MDNQHKYVPGYRDWDEGTTGIIAGLKSFLNKELHERLDMVKQMLQVQMNDALQRMTAAKDALDAAGYMESGDANAVAEREQAHASATEALDVARADYARINEAQRWLAMSRTDFQTGAMKLIRAVAQPTTEF